MMQEDAEDVDRETFIKETAAKAVAKYEGHLPSWVVREMRNALEDVLATHPVGSTLMERVRPRKPPFQSGDVSKDGALSGAVDTSQKRAKG